MKLYLLLLTIVSALPSCPAKWSEQWRAMLGHTIESYLFAEFEASNANLLAEYRRSNCLPEIVSLSCSPDIGVVKGTYPFEVRFFLTN